MKRAERSWIQRLHRAIELDQGPGIVRVPDRPDLVVDGVDPFVGDGFGEDEIALCHPGTDALRVFLADRTLAELLLESTPRVVAVRPQPAEATPETGAPTCQGALAEEAAEDHG